MENPCYKVLLVLVFVNFGYGYGKQIMKGEANLGDMRKMDGNARSWNQPNFHHSYRSDLRRQNFDDENYHDDSSSSEEDAPPIIKKRKRTKVEKWQDFKEHLHSKWLDKFLQIQTKTPPKPPKWATEFHEPPPEIDSPPWYTTV